MQEGMKMHEGSQRRAGGFFSLLRPTQIRCRIFWSTKASVSCSNLSAAMTYGPPEPALSPTRL
jgi:hypothetical protein